MSGRIVAEFQQVDVRTVEKKIVLHSDDGRVQGFRELSHTQRIFGELISRTLRNICAGDVMIGIGGGRFGSAGRLALPKIVPFSFLSRA
jgi:hypothetical protein